MRQEERALRAGFVVATAASCRPVEFFVRRFGASVMKHNGSNCLL
jgi:hypothetical protein